MKISVKKALSIIFIIILLANLVFFGLGRVSLTAFWIILALCAISGYLIRKMKH